MEVIGNFFKVGLLFWWDGSLFGISLGEKWEQKIKIVRMDIFFKEFCCKEKRDMNID